MKIGKVLLFQKIDLFKNYHYSKDMTKEFDELKKEKLRSTMKKVGGNRTLASKRLGISVRTVRNWINKFSLCSEFPPAIGKTPKTRQKK